MRDVKKHFVCRDLRVALKLFTGFRQAIGE